MSANVTRGFVSDHIVAQPRPTFVSGRFAMMSMIAVLVLALAATVLGRGVGDVQGDVTTDVLLLGP